MLDLVLQSLLVLFILLLVLALDDLLSLLGHSIQLHIFCSLLKVTNLKVKSLLLIPNLLEPSLELADVSHEFHFGLTLGNDGLVLFVNHIS